MYINLAIINHFHDYANTKNEQKAYRRRQIFFTLTFGDNAKLAFVFSNMMHAEYAEIYW